MRRNDVGAALLLLAPLLFGFDPLHSRNGDAEQGNSLMKEGKAEEALKHYDKAVAALPGEAAAHFNRGARASDHDRIHRRRGALRPVAVRRGG